MINLCSDGQLLMDSLKVEGNKKAMPVDAHKRKTNFEGEVKIIIYQTDGAKIKQ